MLWWTAGQTSREAAEHSDERSLSAPPARPPALACIDEKVSTARMRDTTNEADSFRAIALRKTNLLSSGVWLSSVGRSISRASCAVSYFSGPSSSPTAQLLRRAASCRRGQPQPEVSRGLEPKASMPAASEQLVRTYVRSFVRTCTTCTTRPVGAKGHSLGLPKEIETGRPSRQTNVSKMCTDPPGPLAVQ